MDVLELIKADHRLVESLSQKLRMLRTPINYTIALTSCTKRSMYRRSRKAKVLPGNPQLHRHENLVDAAQKGEQPSRC